MWYCNPLALAWYKLVYIKKYSYCITTNYDLYCIFDNDGGNSESVIKYMDNWLEAWTVNIIFLNKTERNETLQICIF